MYSIIIKGFFPAGEIENAPCVGICQHNKQKCYEDDQCADFDKGWPLNQIEYGPPCVGICQYMRENNLPIPEYEYPLQNTNNIHEKNSIPFCSELK